MRMVLIDGNSVGYACHYGNVITNTEFQTQAVIGFINYVISRKFRYPQDQLVVLWDGRAKWRFELYPEYKGNRQSSDPKKEESREAYKKQIPLIRDFLKTIGVSQILSRVHEADDVAGLLVQRSKGKEIELVTSDKDWLQLVRNGVLWRDYRTNNIVGTYNFFKETGFLTTEQFVDAKCLKGDKSDNITGVGGIGDKRCEQFLKQFTSVENYFQLVDSGVYIPDNKPYKFLASDEGRQIYYRNKKLMDLTLIPTQINPKESILPVEPNKDRFIELCGMVGCASLANEAQNILDTFRG